MGRSPRPLTVLVADEIAGWPEFTDLQAKGHQIVTGHDLKINTVSMGDVDLFLGPTCWRMDQAHRMYLPLALAAGRKKRYPKEVRE